MVNKMANSTFENGFINFGDAILKAGQPFLEEWKKEKDKYTEVFANVLLDKSGPRRLNRTLPPQEQAFKKIWQGYIEIRESFEVLRDIATYIKHFPPKKAQVSKTRFLRFHIGNYLNEVYILKERLEAYYKVVARTYRNDARLLAKQKQIDDFLQSVFKKVIDIRGAHVHQTRYDDNDLDRLDLIELLLHDDETGLAHSLYPTAIRKTRKQWVEIIIHNNNEIAKVLDIRLVAQ
jgi:hypothetical protein